METEIKQIELNIEAAKEFIELGSLLEKLEQNRAFKKLVIEGYFKDEAVRLVHALSHPSCQSAELQVAITTDLKAIGSFQQYLQRLHSQAQAAKAAIEEDERELETIRSESL